MINKHDLKDPSAYGGDTLLGYNKYGAYTTSKPYPGNKIVNSNLSSLISRTLANKVSGSNSVEL